MSSHELDSNSQSFLASLSSQSPASASAAPDPELESTPPFVMGSSPVTTAPKKKVRIVILVSCPYCQKAQQIVRQKTGRRVVCTQCKLGFQTPQVQFRHRKDS